MENHLPDLTPEQRVAALRKATEARVRRGLARKGLAAGKPTPGRRWQATTPCGGGCRSAFSSNPFRESGGQRQPRSWAGSAYRATGAWVVSIYYFDHHYLLRFGAGRDVGRHRGVEFYT